MEDAHLASIDNEHTQHQQADSHDQFDETFEPILRDDRSERPNKPTQHNLFFRKLKTPHKISLAKTSLLLTSGLTLAACVEEPVDPKATTTQAARFLHQAQFHASDSDIAAVTRDGFESWLDKQIASPISKKGWDWMRSKGFNREEYLFYSLPIDFMMWQQLMTSADSVRKRIALALSEILVVSTNADLGPLPAFTLAAYWDVLNQYAFGNYRDLLEAISLNLGMGYFLNTLGNQKENVETGRQPDENYARELLQLFTIGLYELNMDGSQKLVNEQPIETYTNDDVVNLARVFTGYDRDNKNYYDTLNRPDASKAPMRLDPNLHSLKEKAFLGLTIPPNTNGAESLKRALDHIFNHDNVAPFISKQLIQRLVTSNPSPAYVERVANAFADNGNGIRGDMAAVVRAILLDEEARAEPAEQAYGFGKLREPMLRVLQFAKTFNGYSVSGKWAATNTSDTTWLLSQSFLRSPSVFNFFRPGYVPPNTALADNNMVAPELQITTESSNTNYMNILGFYIEYGISSHAQWDIFEILPNYTRELQLVNQPQALVARLNTLLTADQLSQATVTLITNTIASMKSSGEQWAKRRVWAAIWLIMCSPEYVVQK